MKVKCYVIYYDGELEKMFFNKKKALEYKENLEIYSFDNDVNIEIEKRYIYV